MRAPIRASIQPLPLIALVPVLSGALSCAPAATAPSAPVPEPTRWERQAQRVTIVRDSWGIAHVRGHSDAATYARNFQRYAAAMRAIQARTADSAPWRRLLARPAPISCQAGPDGARPLASRGSHAARVSMRSAR